jgi:hypothetical protein
MFEADEAMLEPSHTTDLSADDGAVINLGNVDGDVITNPELDVDIEYVELDEAEPFEMDEPGQEPYEDEGQPADNQEEEPADGGQPTDDADQPDDRGEPPADGGDEGESHDQHDGPQREWEYDTYNGPIDASNQDRPWPDDGDDGNELPDRSPEVYWETWVEDTFGAEALEHDPVDYLAEVLPWLRPEQLEGLSWEDLTWEDVYHLVAPYNTLAGNGAGSNLLDFLGSLFSGG